MTPYRFHIMWRRINEEEFRDFFQTNDIYEAKDFALRSFQLYHLFHVSEFS